MTQLSLLDDPAPMDLSGLPEGLWVGTSSFSTPDWIGTIYPPGTPPGEFLTHYARSFRTVEVDATWHAMPAPDTVSGWARKVPEGFVLSLKVPKVITHEKGLVGCQEEWGRFWSLTERLGEKRGPLLFQFPYVAKGADPEEFRTGARFRRALAPFLAELPAAGQYAVEVRNAAWVVPELLTLLRERGVALALTAYYTMPHPAEWLEDTSDVDPLTTDFGYVRFLGHHRRMDRLVADARRLRGKTRDWDELLVDREEETRKWLPVLGTLLRRTARTYVYYNNHYAGYAPGSAALLARIWRESEVR